MEDRTQIWSCGGGTQSAAIAALIVQGRLQKPDIAVMVDTEREKSSTWLYAFRVLIPALASVGVDLHIVKKSDFATVDLYGTNGDLLLPAYTTQSGSRSKLPGYCSNEWKRRVIMRWLRKQEVKQGLMWLGISTDEMRRVRMSNVYWLQHRYPLIELELSRSDCIETVKRMGWPKPPRSSCWMCPHMLPAEWEDMRQSSTEDFNNAAQLEEEIRKTDRHIFLHPSCKPLCQLDADVEPMVDDGCTAGLCFV